MFREVCKDSYLLSWLIKKGKNTLFLSILLTHLDSSSHPGWLTEVGNGQSPLLCLQSTDLPWDTTDYVLKSEQISKRFVFYQFRSDSLVVHKRHLTAVNGENMTRPCVPWCWWSVNAKVSGKLSNRFVCWQREFPHTCPFRYEWYHISLLLTCETADCVGLEYLTSVWLSVA